MSAITETSDTRCQFWRAIARYLRTHDKPADSAAHPIQRPLGNRYPMPRAVSITSSPSFLRKART